jgi:serine/threonine protein kinase
MELGGNLADVMNSKSCLQVDEILRIMLQVSLGIARLHYMKPPLLHLVSFGSVMVEARCEV